MKRLWVILSYLYVYQTIYIFYNKQLVLQAGENEPFFPPQNKNILFCHYIQNPNGGAIGGINQGQMSTHLTKRN